MEGVLHRQHETGRGVTASDRLEDAQRRFEAESLATEGARDREVEQAGRVQVREVLVREGRVAIVLRGALGEDRAERLGGLEDLGFGAARAGGGLESLDGHGGFLAGFG